MPIRIVSDERAAELKAASHDWASVTLAGRAFADAEMILLGGYAPLTGYMTREEVESVSKERALPGGHPWPAPLTLSVSDGVKVGDRVALRDGEGVMIAALTVEDAWDEDGRRFAGGPLEALVRPVHYDFRTLRPSADEVRHALSMKGWRRTLAWHPVGVVHRAEREDLLQAAQRARANLLIHPPVGGAAADDLAHYGRVRALRVALDQFSATSAHLALLPHMPLEDGASEALMRGIIAKNHGCTHLLLEPSLDGGLVQERAERLGVEVLQGPASASVYAEIRPEQTFPGVPKELERIRPRRSRQGFTVFFTGLSGAGKSTAAGALLSRLLERGGRPVTLLDGDIVRRNLSSELGFGREHRDLNIRRIGFVASEITKNGGVAICAPIAPYDAVRQEVKAMIEASGGFVLVHVATPLEVCESRDRKGLYAKARSGLIDSFTGISDPYEAPEHADVVLDTQTLSPEEAAQEVVLRLEQLGYLAPERVRR